MTSALRRRSTCITHYRIPLVPRRPVSPDPNAAAAAKAKDTKGKKPNTTLEELPPPPADPDEKLIYDGHCNGVISIDKMVRVCVRVMTRGNVFFQWCRFFVILFRVWSLPCLFSIRYIAFRDK